MASAEDIISPTLIVTPGAAQEQQQPPIFGTVQTAGDPFTALWQDWSTSSVVDSASVVDIIGEASTATKTLLAGKVVRRVTSGVGGRKPSPQFTGIVLAIYRRTPDDGASDPETGPEYCLVKSLDATPTYFEDLATAFEVVDGR